ncbi:MAG: adenylate/guanylate cyclase domain-containing protein [Prochloraceae cyanobacterium]|nr:adenylate/guanylate cyclase domain-containing protein [Prochloraceae cyanobacterium]
MSFLAQNILLPPHIEYVVINKELVILARSSGISRFIDFPEELELGRDIRQSFPELIGYEAILSEILAVQRQNFQLTRIYRALSKERHVYINLYINNYQSRTNSENCLLIFVEDVTESTNIEQKLVHKNNENSLLLSALKSSEKYINQIVTSMADALIVTDLKGRIKTINKKTEELFGYSPAELLDRSIAKIIADRNFLLSEIQQYLLTQGKVFENMEIACQTKSQEQITVAFSCSMIQTDKETSDNYIYIYIGRDITQDERLEKRQIAQHNVTRIISESANLAEATPKILQDICEYLGWDVGELWMIEEVTNEENETKISLAENLKLDQTQPQNSVMRCVESWVKKTVFIPEFTTFAKQMTCYIGQSLPGRVWANNSPQWINDILNDNNFLRKEIALKEGLHGAFGFPIQNDGQMLGVMAFYSKKAQKLDEDLFKVMATIGSQIGQFIKRKKAEQALRYEQEKTETLLLNILPQPIAERLKQQTSTIADNFEEVTVLFADLVGFTPWSSEVSPIEVVEMLNKIFSEFDRLTEKHQLEKIKTIGDAYMVVGGLPTPRGDSARSIGSMALDIIETIDRFNASYNKDFRIRIGINTGPVVAGVIGTKKFIYDLWGDTVNIASRMESQGVPNKIQVTATTYDRLKDKYLFKQRTPIYIKGKGKMITYMLVGRK